jgi:hypothetical protein
MEKLTSSSLYLEEDSYTHTLLRLIIVVRALFGKLVILLSSPPPLLKIARPLRGSYIQLKRNAETEKQKQSTPEQAELGLFHLHLACPSSLCIYGSYVIRSVGTNGYGAKMLPLIHTSGCQMRWNGRKSELHRDCALQSNATLDAIQSRMQLWTPNRGSA